VKEFTLSEEGGSKTKKLDSKEKKSKSKPAKAPLDG